MELSERDTAFLADNHSAAMITTGADGYPKPVRVGLSVVEGRLWSSGTQDRVRTRRLRTDPRCTLFVFDAKYAWLALETTVTIIDGPSAASDNLRLFRQMQGRPTGPLTWFGSELEEADFLQRMVEEKRVIYEFSPTHSYGLL